MQMQSFSDDEQRASTATPEPREGGRSLASHHECFASRQPRSPGPVPASYCRTTGGHVMCEAFDGFSGLCCAMICSEVIAHVQGERKKEAALLAPGSHQ